MIDVAAAVGARSCFTPAFKNNGITCICNKDGLHVWNGKIALRCFAALFWRDKGFDEKKKKKRTGKYQRWVWMEIDSDGSIPRRCFGFSVVLVSLSVSLSFQTSKGNLCMWETEPINWTLTIQSVLLNLVNQNQQQEGKHTVNATYVGRLQAMKSNNVCKLCGWTEGRNRITIKQSGKTGPSVLPVLH